MKPTRILVVDDNKDTCKLLALAITRMGYKTYIANGGAEGIAKAVRLRPDLVLLDYQMPDIDGLEVLRELRRRGISLRVIVFTAARDLQTAIEFIKAGAFDFISKPADPETLKARIARALTLHSPRVSVSLEAVQSSHPNLFGKVTPLLAAQAYDHVVLETFIYLEEFLRQTLDVGPEAFGEDLINMAFAQKVGRLQLSKNESEQRGLRNFVSGAYALFRNPAAHRVVAHNEFTATTIVNMVGFVCDIAAGLAPDTTEGDETVTITLSDNRDSST